MQGSITTSTENNITTITFAHPAHNSMPGHQLKALTEAINTAGENKLSTIIVIQSAGERTFCAGASFDELAAIDNFDDGKKFFMGFANVINACRKSPKLIIGRIQGKAVGGGVGIAAAVDYCLATKYASVKLSEIALGIGPFVVGPAVERKIGLSNFSQLAINSTTWQSAQWAKDNGLFAELFESTPEMDERITEFSSELAAMSPEALIELKKILWAGAESWDVLLESRAEISGRLVLSDFTKKAITRIKEKS